MAAPGRQPLAYIPVPLLLRPQIPHWLEVWTLKRSIRAREADPPGSQAPGSRRLRTSHFFERSTEGTTAPPVHRPGTLARSREAPADPRFVDVQVEPQAKRGTIRPAPRLAPPLPAAQREAPPPQTSRPAFSPDIPSCTPPGPVFSWPRSGYAITERAPHPSKHPSTVVRPGGAIPGAVSSRPWPSPLHHRRRPALHRAGRRRGHHLQRSESTGGESPHSCSIRPAHEFLLLAHWTVDVFTEGLPQGLRQPPFGVLG